MNKRKREIKKKTRRNIRINTLTLVILAVVSIACMLFMYSKFIFFDVIVPTITLETVATFVGVSLIVFVIVAVNSSNKLNMIEDIVIDNKITLQDSAECDEERLDELIQIKGKIKKIEKVLGK